MRRFYYNFFSVVVLSFPEPVCIATLLKSTNKKSLCLCKKGRKKIDAIKGKGEHL